MEKKRVQLKVLYQELADMTKPLCATACQLPISCCSPEYCEFVIEYAKDCWGEELQRTNHERLPLMGPDGCTAAPHLRPMCSAHVCEGTLYRQEQEYLDKYFKLRDKISDLELKLKL